MGETRCRGGLKSQNGEHGAKETGEKGNPTNLPSSHQKSPNEPLQKNWDGATLSTAPQNSLLGDSTV